MGPPPIHQPNKQKLTLGPCWPSGRRGPAVGRDHTFPAEEKGPRGGTLENPPGSESQVEGSKSGRLHGEVPTVCLKAWFNTCAYQRKEGEGALVEASSVWWQVEWIGVTEA